MHRATISVAAVLWLWSAAFAQDAVRGDSSIPTSDPLHIDKVEKETVRLILVDLLVLDD